MVSRNSRSEYERRMHRVIAHIDEHLDQALDLNALADVAHFSRFHFHRLFAAWMGETLGDYLRRRRLEIAAMRLAAQPRAAVLNIALSAGFGSAEAFSRAFRSRFGSSPTGWRAQQAMLRGANSNPDQVDSKASQASSALSPEHSASRNRRMEATMNVKIFDRQPVTVAYLRHLGSYGAPIATFWQDTYYPWAYTNNLLDRARYGISHDDPGITAPAQCRYDACAEVTPDFVASGGALKATIPGGRYAVFSFKGSVAEVGAAWTALLRDWLPSSGQQLDARPCFKYYPRDAECDSKAGAFQCEICIPVVPL